MIIEELKKLYITHTGHEPEAIDELPSSGSNRRYFRLKGTPTLIGVSAEGFHLFSFRTQKLSPHTPTVLCWRRHGRIGSCRIPKKQSKDCFFFCSCFYLHFDYHLKGTMQKIYTHFCLTSERSISIMCIPKIEEGACI